MNLPQQQHAPELAAPDVALPARWYHDPAIYAAEAERIFWREWILAGREDQLAAPGDYVTAVLCGRSVFVIRDRDGALRGFHNVCRHRASPLLWDAAGRCDVLRCPYHGWVYDTRGRLRRTPEFGDEGTLSRADHNLFPIRVETWRGLVFVNLDLSARPLAEGLGDLVPELADVPLERFRYHGRTVFDLACNWKTYLDNYMEGYHIPYLHPGLTAALDAKAYRVRNGTRVCVHLAPTRIDAPYKGRFLWRFPNNTIGYYGYGLNVSTIVPLGPDRMQLVVDFFFDPSVAEEEKQAAMASTREVLQEDFPMCEAVQRNLEAGPYDTGPLSPLHENGVLHFHDMVRACIGAPPG